MQQEKREIAKSIVAKGPEMSLIQYEEGYIKALFLCRIPPYTQPYD